MTTDKKRKEILRLVDGCNDLTLPRDRLAEVLVCDEASIERVLDAMGFQSCNCCSVWKTVSDVTTEDPESPGDRLCEACAKEKGLAIAS
jgi:hypothetical protein